jgi:hypothetical protein
VLTTIFTKGSFRNDYCYQLVNIGFGLSFTYLPLWKVYYCDWLDSLKTIVDLTSNLAVDWSNRRRLLREIAFRGDPAGAAEEAPQTPLGKRSLVRKSIAAFNKPFE